MQTRNRTEDQLISKLSLYIALVDCCFDENQELHEEMEHAYSRYALAYSLAAEQLLKINPEYYV